MISTRTAALAITLTALTGSAAGQHQCAVTHPLQTFNHTGSWGWRNASVAIVGDTLYQGVHWPQGVITRFDISDPANIVELPGIQLPPIITDALSRFDELDDGLRNYRALAVGDEIFFGNECGIAVYNTQTGAFGWAGEDISGSGILPYDVWGATYLVADGRTLYAVPDTYAILDAIDIDGMYNIGTPAGSDWGDARTTLAGPFPDDQLASVATHNGKVYVGTENWFGGDNPLYQYDLQTSSVSTLRPSFPIIFQGVETGHLATNNSPYVDLWDLEPAAFPSSPAHRLLTFSNSVMFVLGSVVVAWPFADSPARVFELDRSEGELTVAQFDDIELPDTPGNVRGFDRVAMNDDGVLFFVSHLSLTTRIFSVDISECLSQGPAECPGDIADDFGTLGSDGMVSFGDFLALLGLIGPCDGGSTPGCTGDIADDFGTLGPDGMVGFGDFLALLGLIGPCP